MIETKLDDSFPAAQFTIPVFCTPYRLDRTINTGGIILYVREDIPSKSITCPQSANPIECIFIEINFHKKKWLIGSSYNPSKATITGHLETISGHLNYLYTHYDNILLMGDFNSEPFEHDMSEFCTLNNLKNLITEPTCYKNAEHPSYIDLMLTNRCKSFKCTTII